jgi:hypothetical protein
MGPNQTTRRSNQVVGDTYHFKNAAKKAKFLRGEISADEAMHKVPTFHGISNDTYKTVVANVKYGRKLAMRRAANEAEEDGQDGV